MLLFFSPCYSFSQTSITDQLQKQDELLMTAESLLVKTLGKNNLLVEQLRVSSTKIENLNAQLTDSASKLGLLAVQLQTAQQNLNKSNNKLTQAQNQLQTSEDLSKKQLDSLDRAERSITKLEWENRLMKFGGSLLIGVVVVGGLVLIGNEIGKNI